MQGKSWFDRGEVGWRADRLREWDSEPTAPTTSCRPHVGGPTTIERGTLASYEHWRDRMRPTKTAVPPPFELASMDGMPFPPGITDTANPHEKRGFGTFPKHPQ